MMRRWRRRGARADRRESRERSHEHALPRWHRVGVPGADGFGWLTGGGVDGVGDAGEVDVLEVNGVSRSGWGGGRVGCGRGGGDELIVGLGDGLDGGVRVFGGVGVERWGAVDFDEGQRGVTLASLRLAAVLNGFIGCSSRLDAGGIGDGRENDRVRNRSLRGRVLGMLLRDGGGDFDLRVPARLSLCSGSGSIDRGCAIEEILSRLFERRTGWIVSSSGRSRTARTASCARGLAS